MFFVAQIVLHAALLGAFVDIKPIAWWRAYHVLLLVPRLPISVGIVRRATTPCFAQKAFRIDVADGVVFDVDIS